jgi:hypothetical protein
MMNLISKLFLSLLLGLAFAFGFNSLFLHLLDRPVIDQILLIFFSTAAIGYLALSLLCSREELLDTLRIKNLSINRVAASSFLREHAAGLMLALLFFALYTCIGLKLNISHLDTVDNFLDADNSSWMARISSPGGNNMELRGPHPFTYFILRPFGWFLNLFTQDPGLSAILLNTFSGGLCVFLAWVLIKNHTQNRVYAFSIASLLGLSTAHIFFGSVIESYIFSAAALIGFFLILQKRKDSMRSLVGASLITFGITLTNFVQNLIGFVVSRPRIRDIIRFSGLTISIGIILSLIHAAWYPSSKLFFLPSSAQAEEEFAFSVFLEPAWRAIGRVVLLIRTILLYTVIAPRPYVFGQEVGGTFPRFNFFKVVPGTFSYSSYNGLGNVLVFAWVALLLISGIFFLWNFIRTRKADLTLALVLCILFNFILHLNYGYEPFLYSPDWAYALIFFVGLSLAPLAKNKIFQSGLLFFLVMLAYNQWRFFKFIFDVIKPYTG